MASRAIRFIKGRLESIAANLPRRSSSGDSLILAYHNVVPGKEAGFGESSLHLDLEDFESQLQIAKQECDLVSLPELLEFHGRPGRRVAITFDDAYSGCVRWGIPACTGAGVRPVIFIAPAILGHFMPWDLRAAQTKWSPQHREQFLESGGVASTAMSEHSYNLLPESYRLATLEQIHRAATQHSFDVANHTFRHINLGVSTTESAVDEIVRAEDFLQSELADRVMPGCIAYPYGLAPQSLDTTNLTRHIRVGFKIDGGWQRKHRRTADPAVNRLNIPAGGSLHRFRAQVRGWLS